MTVKSKITKRIIIRAIIMLLVAAALVAIYIYYIPRLEKSKFGIFAIPFFTLVYAYILFKSKLIHLMLDKDWEGKVISSTVILDYVPITFGEAVSRRPPRKIHYTILQVSRNGGKTVKLKIPSDKVAPSIFRPDDILKHYKGTKYPQNVSRSEEIFICPVCGRSLDESDCPRCKINFKVTSRRYDPYYEWWNN